MSIDVLAAARSLIGTPYVPQGRLPGIGIDCVGVPIVTAWLAGIKPRTFDIKAYSMKPDGSMLPLCERYMDRVTPEGDTRAGDVVICKWGDEPHHVGIVGDWRHGGLSIIHAEDHRHHKVIEHRLWFDGAMKFVAAYRFRGLR